MAGVGLEGGPLLLTIRVMPGLWGRAFTLVPLLEVRQQIPAAAPASRAMPLHIVAQPIDVPRNSSLTQQLRQNQCTLAHRSSNEISGEAFQFQSNGFADGVPPLRNRKFA